MKLTSLALLLLAFGQALAAMPHPPHLDLETTPEEYRALLGNLKKVKNRSKRIQNVEAQVLGLSIAMGTRMLQLLEKINASRTSETMLRLTSAETRRGISIATPSFLSVVSIQKLFEECQSKMPDALKATLNGTGPLPDSLPVSDAEFLTSARALSKVYQSSARFRLLAPWTEWYTEKAKTDVRGYYYLTSNKIDAEALKAATSFEMDKLTAIKNALTQVCFNNPEMKLDVCEAEVAVAAEETKLPEVYLKYIDGSSVVWSNFFNIPQNAVRKDISWTSEMASLPFITPELPNFIPYLKDNIEEEFQWKGWRLVLNMGPHENSPMLILSPGVNPHVDALGGNLIVMDKNVSIEEYESKWTIRHEFGHVLGLPDCYHEFYDVKLKAFVNYQLDTTDLMCSRAGNMNERIFNELKRNYDKASL